MYITHIPQIEEIKQTHDEELENLRQGHDEKVSNLKCQIEDASVAILDKKHKNQKEIETLKDTLQCSYDSKEFELNTESDCHKGERNGNGEEKSRTI
jgi:hypothetical protein